MSFLDPAYAVLMAKTDMARHLPPHSIVILGDSRAKAGFVPGRIGPDVYNLALDGGTSIEISVYARILLSSPHPPRAVIVSISPYHCATTHSFYGWVKLRLFDWSTLDEIRARSRRLNAPVFSPSTELTVDQLTPLFGPERPGDAEARLAVALWSLHFPSLDFYSLAAGVLLGRKNENLKAYKEAHESRGFQTIGPSDGCRTLCRETRIQTFTPSPLLDSYFSDTVSLFQDKKIPVYYIATPVSDLSRAAMDPGFVTAYTGYIKSYEKRYPNFLQVGDPIPSLPWVDLKDADHLDSQGAIQFSDQVAELLKQAGLEK